MADQWQQQQPQPFDIVTKLAWGGFFHIAETILSFLDASSLHNASRVSTDWLKIICDGRLWIKLVARMVNSDPIWARLAQRRGLTVVPRGLAYVNPSEENIYFSIAADIIELDERWRAGQFTARKLSLDETLPTDIVKCDDDTVMVGSYTRGVQIFDAKGRVCRKEFKRHIGRVTCMQYDDRMIMCASSDGYILVWDRNDPCGSMPCNTLLGHPHHVADLKFSNSLLIGCPISQPYLIIWTIGSPREIRLTNFLDLAGDLSFHVDFDEKYIVSGSLSGTIRVWDVKTFEQLWAMRASKVLHSCQYQNGLAVGSCNQKIMIWRVESGTLVRTLDSGTCPFTTFNSNTHNLIRFDRKRFMALTQSIIRTQHIRVWDLAAILNGDVPNEALTYVTMALPYNFLAQDLQFDAMKIKCWTARAMLILDFDIQSQRAETKTHHSKPAR